jgi:hypothetical protein
MIEQGFKPSKTESYGDIPVNLNDDATPRLLLDISPIHLKATQEGNQNNNFAFKPSHTFTNMVENLKKQGTVSEEDLYSSSSEEESPQNYPKQRNHMVNRDPRFDDSMFIDNIINLIQSKMIDVVIEEKGYT